MNFSEDNIHIIHVQKKHKCTMCDFRTHKKYNLNVHLRGIHGISNLSSVVTSIIPIEKYKEVAESTHNWKAESKKWEDEYVASENWIKEKEDEILSLKNNLQEAYTANNIWGQIDCSRNIDWKMENLLWNT